MKLVSRTERYVYKVLQGTPRIRRIATLCWQSLWSLGPAPAVKAAGRFSIFPNVFFGFHDKCPWSADQDNVAVHIIPQQKSSWSRRGELGIGVLRPTDGKIKWLEQTRAWNWQQGAQLQWNDRTNELVFNDLAPNGEPRVRSVTMDGEKEEVADGHIAAIAKGTSVAIQTDFTQLERVMPGYGYRGTKKAAGGTNVAMSSLDLASGTRATLVTWNAIRKTLGLENRALSRSNASVSHVAFSPSGLFLAFFVIMLSRRGRKIYLLTMDISTRTLRWIQFKSPSHYCWVDDYSLFVTHLSDDASWLGSWVALKEQDPEVKTDLQLCHGDAHVSYSSARRELLIDTYPDRGRIQRLLLMDCMTGETQLLFESQIPLAFSGIWRCDFHPRWRPDGGAICFDTAHTGSRSLCIMERD